MFTCGGITFAFGEITFILGEVGCTFLGILKILRFLEFYFCCWGGFVGRGPHRGFRKDLIVEGCEPERVQEERE